MRDSNRYYEAMFRWAFSAENPGYRPEVVEAPHGDGRVDARKEYAHVGPRYGVPMESGTAYLFQRLYNRAFSLSLNWGLPPPSSEESVLRFLRYPTGVGGEAHTDFSLFTLNEWRSHPFAMRPEFGAAYHLGELAELFHPGRQAQPHWIEPQPEPQLSVVFFALPSRGERLPDGRTVGEWLDERKARSRVAKSM